VFRFDEQAETWDYLGTALSEDFHLSYPHVFEAGGEIYMTPETKKSRSVRLYRAVDVPLKWELDRVLLSGLKRVDPAVMCWEDHWYLFARRKRKLFLYHADSLKGPWMAHPGSPVKRWNYARGAERLFQDRDALYRFAQEQREGYGSCVHAYRIITLSPTCHREEKCGKMNSAIGKCTGCGVRTGWPSLRYPSHGT